MRGNAPRAGAQVTRWARAKEEWMASVVDIVGVVRELPNPDFTTLDAADCSLRS